MRLSINLRWIESTFSKKMLVSLALSMGLVLCHKCMGRTSKNMAYIARGNLRLESGTRKRIIAK